MVFYQSICLVRSNGTETFVFRNKIINCRAEQKILRIIIDNKLTFGNHVKKLCKKTLRKIWALAKLSSYLNDAGKI